MEHYDCIHEKLRTLKWHKMTKHYKQLLLPRYTTGWGQLMTGNGDHWLVNKDNEVARLPHYLAMSIIGHHSETRGWGPYRFYNNFGLTKEAEYLKEMFKYVCLTATASKKVHTILKENQEWVQIDTNFVMALTAREGDNWLKEVIDGQ